MREPPDPLTALIVGIILVVLGGIAAGMTWLARKRKGRGSGGSDGGAD